RRRASGDSRRPRASRAVRQAERDRSSWLLQTSDAPTLLPRVALLLAASTLRKPRRRRARERRQQRRDRPGPEGAPPHTGPVGQVVEPAGDEEPDEVEAGPQPHVLDDGVADRGERNGLAHPPGEQSGDRERGPPVPHDERRGLA